MAGVSDKIFRQLCKERGADVLVTEFVSAEGVFRRNERTREYLDFDECERPLGVQLFGGNAEHMAEAAKHVVDWVRPDFIDLNFGCPVNKVVAKNGGSALLKDCPTLAAVAEAVVRAVAPLPVTAKIRIGWDDRLDQRSAGRAHSRRYGHPRSRGPWPHAGAGLFRRGRLGRDRRSGRGGFDSGHRQRRPDQWRRCGAAPRRNRNRRRDDRPRRDEFAVDFQSDETLLCHRRTSGFAQPAEKWELIQRHCQLAVEEWGCEDQAIRSMRARLMAYSKGFPNSKMLREKFQHVSTLAEIDEIASQHMTPQGAAV